MPFARTSPTNLDASGAACEGLYLNLSARASLAWSLKRQWDHSLSTCSRLRAVVARTVCSTLVI